MVFYFPNQIHILKYIKDNNQLLGIKHMDRSYVIGMMNPNETVYLTRMISDKAVGTLYDYKPIRAHPDHSDHQNDNSLYLHDNIHFSLTKENKPEFDWIVDTLNMNELFEYPRKKNIGLIMPTTKINETYKILEYKALVIEPMFDTRSFLPDI